MRKVAIIFNPITGTVEKEFKYFFSWSLGRELRKLVKSCEYDLMADGYKFVGFDYNIDYVYMKITHSYLDNALFYRLICAKC